MTELETGNLLCEHITEVLNRIITTTGEQIQKDNKEIWDGFLHQLNNDEWAAMFLAFKTLVDRENLSLRPDQQRKFDAAYTTFKRDSLLRERCMDIRNRAKNTKDLAWAMIMTIREVWNFSKGLDIPNVNTKLPEPETAYEKRKYRREINIQIQETLFEL
jgi:hypothetical protein